VWQDSISKDLGYWILSGHHSTEPAHRESSWGDKRCKLLKTEMLLTIISDYENGLNDQLEYALKRAHRFNPIALEEGSI